MLELKVHSRFLVKILAEPLPVEVTAKIGVKAPVNQFCLRLLLRAIPNITSGEVCVQPPRESHIRAIVLRLAIPVRAVVEVAAVAIVLPTVSEAFAGAVVIGRFARTSGIAFHRIEPHKATIRRSRTMRLQSRLGKATTRSRRQHLKSDLLLLIDLPTAVDTAKLIMFFDEVVARH